MPEEGTQACVSPVANRPCEHSPRTDHEARRTAATDHLQLAARGTEAKPLDDHQRHHDETARPRSASSRTRTIGVIPTVTKPFCENCDRVRLTADGQFRTCLFATIDDDLTEEIERAVGTKWRGHQINQRRLAAALSKMSCAGGISTSGHEKICDQLVDEWLDEQRATRQIRNRRRCRRMSTR